MSWEPYRANEYVDFDEVQSFCEGLADTHPEWAELEEVGESREGRPLYLLTVSARETGPDGSERGLRPALWLDAATHAAEWTGVSAVLYIVSRWIDGLSGGDEALKSWFRRREALVMPCISPDGYQAMHEGSPFLRSNKRPPAEGEVRKGLDPRDIDGDGTVRMMRWKHPAGSFVPDEAWEPFLRPRRLDDDPDEAYFLCDEGLFINWDGVEWTEAPAEFGLDLNRNFPAHWKPFSMFGMDSGSYPLSEPESRAVVDTFASHPHIGCALTMHTYMGCILTQPYRDDTPLGDGDIELMEMIADDLAEGTGYDVHRVHPDFMYEEGNPIPGVWADTMSTVFGVPGYTVELWDPFEHVGVELEDPASFFQDPDQETILAYLQGIAEDPSNVQSWQTVEHPQLGTVEVGGLEYLRTLRNPPVDELDGECETAWRMAERARRALPDVSADVRVTSNGENSHTVRVILENVGCLPTSGLKRGEEVAETPGVRLSLNPDDDLEVEGPLERNLDHMEGWGNLRTGSGRHPLYAGLSRRGHRVWSEWTVHGEGTLEIDWFAGRAGRGSEAVELAD
jgi:hypothetical protein